MGRALEAAMTHEDPKPDTPVRPAMGLSTWILVAFMAIALFLLLAEHRAHAFGWWPHLLLGVCVLLLYLGGAHAGRIEEQRRHQTPEDRRP